MVSLAQGNTLRKSAFCLGFLFKDFCYHPTQVLLLSLQDVGVYIASSPQGVTLG